MLSRRCSISPDSLKDVVRDAIRAGDPTIRSAAALLGTSPRSLQRELESQAITYSGIVDEVRYEIACTLLAKTRLDIAEVGAALGYRDPSSFSRAFMRWAGASPRHYRASHAAADALPDGESCAAAIALANDGVGRVPLERKA